MRKLILLFWVCGFASYAQVPIINPKVSDIINELNYDGSSLSTNVKFQDLVNASKIQGFDPTYAGSVNNKNQIVSLGQFRNYPKLVTPTISANKTDVCDSELATLTSSCVFGSLIWSNSATGSPVSVGQGTYTVLCNRKDKNSSASSSVTITRTNTPNAPTLSISNSTICSGTYASITASGCSGTLTWSDGQPGANNPIYVGSTGNYTATCSNSCGTSGNSNTVSLTVITVPSAPTISANKGTVCGSEMATLTATGCAGTVNWNIGASGTSINVGAGTYTATCSNDCGESAASSPVTITSIPIPSAPVITANKFNICGGDFATLSATTACASGSTIEWSTQDTTSTINVYSAGKYYARCKSACGNSGWSNEVEIASDCGSGCVTPILQLANVNTRIELGTSLITDFDVVISNYDSNCDYEIRASGKFSGWPGRPNYDFGEWIDINSSLVASTYVNVVWQRGYQARVKGQGTYGQLIVDGYDITQTDVQNPTVTFGGACYLFRDDTVYIDWHSYTNRSGMTYLRTQDWTSYHTAGTTYTSYNLTSSGLGGDLVFITTMAGSSETGIAKAKGRIFVSECK